MPLMHVLLYILDGRTYFCVDIRHLSLLHPPPLHLCLSALDTLPVSLSNLATLCGSLGSQRFCRWGEGGSVSIHSSLYHYRNFRSRLLVKTVKLEPVND